MNTLENPSKHDCRKKLLPDEPIFILRGKDPNLEGKGPNFYASNKEAMDFINDCVEKENEKSAA